MDSILNLFTWFAIIVALVTMLFPIVYDIIARRRNAVFKIDSKLFEIYIYFTFVLQSFAVILSQGFGLHNLFLFRFYLPLHTALFTYFLLKWLGGKNTNVILIIVLSIIVSVLGDFLTGNHNTPPHFMIWFDAVLLLSLSFVLSFLNDKKKVHLPKENNFIHIGIYLYSIITLIGLLPSFIGLSLYGFFLQSVAVIVSNIFFARSFKCL